MMLARTLKEQDVKTDKVSSYQAVLDQKYAPSPDLKTEKPLDAKNLGLWAVLGLISAAFMYVTFIM